jgi:hypothetical protein
MKWLNYYKMKFMLIGFVAGVVFGGGSAKADFVFGEPMDLGPPINGSYLDASPSIFADGLEFYFASNRAGGSGDLDIWLSTRQTMNDDWGEPVNLGSNINSSDMDSSPTISPDGLELYFSRGGWSNQYIFASRRPSKDAPWGSALRLGPDFNSYSAGHPEFSADGLSLYFVSNRPDGMGGYDIWMTTRIKTDGTWSEPVNLGPNVNSLYNDYGPSISSYSRILFFDSYRSGTGTDEQWLTVRLSEHDGWGPPMILGQHINSGYQEGDAEISPDGSCLYFSFVNNSVDIYQSKISPIVDLNSDGNVDTDDLQIMIDNWGTSETLCDIGPTPLGDGIVDVLDLVVLTEYIEPIDRTLIAHWELDQIEGDIAQDSTVGDNDADVFGDPTWQPDGGKVGGALQFDGVDDYLSTPFILNPSGVSFSATAWIKGGTSGQVIISQADVEGQSATESGSAWLGISPSDGKLMTGLMSIFFGTLESGSVVTNGQWHHVGLVYDSTAMKRHLYVDGAEVAVDDGVIAGVQSTAGLYIGVGQTLDAGSFFSGLIDDVRIYNRAIDAIDIL